MKIAKWQFWTAVSFISLSTLFYLIDYLIFHNFQDLTYSLISNLAFVFIQVLLVTMILENHMEKREKKKRMEKLNMVIGIFFSKAGTEILHSFTELDPQIESIRNDLMIDKNWNRNHFSVIKEKLKLYKHELKISHTELETIALYFEKEEDFLLQLLENPTLMEHESFTDLLQATFHLAEELQLRENLKELPISDIKHLQGDCQRVYALIIMEWLCYMEYLEENYPYLFSLAMRTNPFLKNSSVIITE